MSEADSGTRSTAEAIEQLLSVRIVLRNNRWLHIAMRVLRLPAVKTLKQFDFAFQPRIKREQIENLHELGFLDRAENMVMLGPPGVGKTHLVISPAIAAERAATAGVAAGLPGGAQLPGRRGGYGPARIAAAPTEQAAEGIRWGLAPSSLGDRLRTIGAQSVSPWLVRSGGSAGGTRPAFFRMHEQNRHFEWVYWRSLGDSNPCPRRERAVSWAARRRERERAALMDDYRVTVIIRGAAGGSTHGPHALSAT